MIKLLKNKAESLGVHYKGDAFYINNVAVSFPTSTMVLYERNKSQVAIIFWKRFNRMNVYLAKLLLNDLSDTELEIYHNLDSRKYGEQLAFKVAQKLKANPAESDGLYLAHRDYCGMGLYIHNGKFTLGTVYDARGPYPIVADFDSEAAFIGWLANENDQSMALYGECFCNQTLTRIRLEWYLEDDHSPIWNAFCAYRRKRADDEENHNHKNPL